MSRKFRCVSPEEYSLLKIGIAHQVYDFRGHEVEEEQIYLLKMICPSSEFIYVMRVLPDMKSAREAICWVNWGVDPGEFQAQTSKVTEVTERYYRTDTKYCDQLLPITDKIRKLM
ncbi:MAG: hypothetical protein ICV63_10350 [Coleofasciculus sp. Co-bin14]|nr:hypothetical protein [Coleofasciculus sp. Co-bin14]